MFTFNERKLLGFLDLDLGAIEVRVPVRSAAPAEEFLPTSAPIVALECEGSTCEIVVRADAASSAVTEHMHEVAERALRHLSQKLLN